MAAKKEEVKVIKVVRTGESIGIPETLTIKDAITALQRQLEADEEVTSFNERISAFPYDGALAMVRAMEELFGYAAAAPIPGWFGPQPPQMISVDTGVGSSVLIPWGRFTIPGVEGNINTGTWNTTDGLVQFQITANVKRKNEPHVRRLAELTRKLVSEGSIYRGKAIRIKFYDADGDRIPIPMPTFIDLSDVRPKELIFSEDVQRAIETNLFAPIAYPDACRSIGVPGKRSILLGGPFGTGKSLTANVAAKMCEENGRTFVYATNTDELPDALHFARQYAPSLVFCEDIDQETEGERDADLNAILNTIDGIDTKSADVIIVMTTNHAEKITKAMLRPGRVDALIEVLPPDAEAAQRLLRMYGRGLIPETEDLSEVANQLKGMIPAVLREVVEKSKLAAVWLSGGSKNLTITAEALMIAAKSMEPQLRLLYGDPSSRKLTPGEMVAHGIEGLLNEQNNGKLSEKLENAQVWVDHGDGVKLWGKVRTDA